MKKDLLICIAFHYDSERIQYLQKVLDNFLHNFKCSHDIIIDTNSSKFTDNTNIKFYSHNNLSHPFHLTWKHREHFKREIDNYENFAYFEDDMLIPYENYLNYLENFESLWAERSVPSFVRIEEKDGEQFLTDQTKQQKKDIIKIGDKGFVNLIYPYCACWIMPAKELKETMIDNFVRVHESRETAASYPMWELNKIPLVEIENGQISKKSYAYHIANNYVNSKESPFAKIKPENLFI